MSESQDPRIQAPGGDEDNIVTLKGMYQDYFLDYASYVILERAVPAVLDGLKPVQRRILHAMKEMDDGRYHKVANIIGQTMQFHPTVTPPLAMPSSTWARKTSSSTPRATGATPAPATGRRRPATSKPA